MAIVNENLAYQILDLLVKNGGRMEYTAILNALMPTPATDTLDTLTDMIDQNLIKGITKADEYLKITIKGKRELQVHQKQLQNDTENAAKDIANKRSEHRFQIINTIISGAIGGLIGTVLGSFISLFFEHILLK